MSIVYVMVKIKMLKITLSISDKKFLKSYIQEEYKIHGSLIDLQDPCEKWYEENV